MNLLKHTCDPESKYATRVAYSPDTKQFFIEFKAGQVYRYEGVPGIHFDGVMFTKTRLRDWMEANPDADHSNPPKDYAGAKLGSEGSYLIAHVVGRDRKNPPFTYRKLDPDEAAAIFHYAAAA